MTELIRYEAARRALTACKAVDEVKVWVDKAAAMQAYGRMAKDRTLEADAAEIRIRAERRLGEMIALQKTGPGLNRGAKVAGSKPGANDGSSAVVTDDHRPTLAAAGISKDLSARAQKLAAVPAAEFEAVLAEKRERDRQEGARISARLEKSGERHLRQQEPQPYVIEDGEPSQEEQAYLEQAEQEFQIKLQALLDADDALATATAKWKQAELRCEQLQLRINGLLNENAELIRSVKYWRRQADKAAA